MFVDLVLARRLEATEGHVGASYVAARDRTSGAATERFGGIVAVFDGADSPLTQTFGLGLDGPPALAAIEQFFTSRGADTLHEVSPFAGVETVALLATRGYVPVELSTVLVQPIEDLPMSTTLSVRKIDPLRDGETWIATSIAGWSSDPAVVPFIRSMAEVSLANAAMMHYLVEHEGAPIATGSMGIHDGIALLAGASTVPAARGIGAQSAILAARLTAAREYGCSVAMMVTAVGSTSQRNAERRGFRVAYTRTKWRRSAEPPTLRPDLDKPRT